MRPRRPRMPADRAAVIAALDQQLKRGDKALIGNSAYRRYLRPTAKHAFEIDPGKVADGARFDGIFVLRTNARITPLQAVLRYRDLIPAAWTDDSAVNWSGSTWCDSQSPPGWGATMAVVIMRLDLSAAELREAA